MTSSCLKPKILSFYLPTMWPKMKIPVLFARWKRSRLENYLGSDGKDIVKAAKRKRISWNDEAGAKTVVGDHDVSGEDDETHVTDDSKKQRRVDNLVTVVGEPKAKVAKGRKKRKKANHVSKIMKTNKISKRETPSRPNVGLRK